MVAALLTDLQYLFGSQLAAWATQLHAVALSAVAAAWGWPVVHSLFKRMPRSLPEVEWVSLWRCPRCQTFNRRSFVTCTHCEYHLTIGGMAKWIPLKVAEKFKRGGRGLVILYTSIGWMFYYGLTIAVFCKLRLYTFHQEPLQELIGSATLLFLLLSVVFFQLALRPRLKSPLAFFTDLFAGALLTSFFLFGSLVWSAVPFPPEKPLAHLQTYTNSTIRLTPTGSTGQDITGSAAGGFVHFNMDYLIISWPSLSYRRVFLNPPGKKSPSPWTYKTLKNAAPYFQSPQRLCPQFFSLRQTFSLEHEATYTISDALNGSGLVLHKLGSNPKRDPPNLGVIRKVLILLLTLASAAVAEVSTDTASEFPLWEAGIVGGGGYMPDYPGSGQNHAKGMGAPYVIYRGKILRADREGVRGQIIRSRLWEIDLSAAGSFASRSDDNDARENMPDLDYLVELGPRLNVTLANYGGNKGKLRLHVPFRAVFSADWGDFQHRGYTFSPSLYFRHDLGRDPHRFVLMQLSANFGDREICAYFYDVTPAFARPDRPIYDARGGYVGSDLAGGVVLPFGKRLRIFLGGQALVHSGSANAGSPLFKREFNYSLGGGLVWTIFKSKRPAVFIE